MSITNTTGNKITDTNTLSDKITFTNMDTTNLTAIPFDEKDFKTLILIKGGAANGTVTFKKGNGIQGVKDLVVDIPQTEIFAITLDSGFFKQVSGSEAKGSVLALASANDIKVATVFLP